MSGQEHGPRRLLVEECLERGLAAIARLRQLEADRGALSPVLEAVELVLSMRRRPPARPAWFRIVERYHDSGHRYLVLLAENREAAALVDESRPRDLLEARLFLGERWPGGALDIALELLEGRMGTYLRGGPTTRPDVAPVALLGGSDG